MTHTAPPSRDQLEARLHFPLGAVLPEPGQALVVAPGVKWLRMGLPFALDHINLWLLRDEIDGRAGWTVVDTCIDRPEVRAQWDAVIAHALEGLPVLRVLATHMHPDHIGLAHWLVDRFSSDQHRCGFWISATDYYAARVASQSTTGFGGEAAARFFAQHGLSDPQALERIRERASYYPSLVPAVPPSYRRLVDGETLHIGGHTWTLIAGRGHSPEHISLHCVALGVLISGDMLLPRISTNVSVYDIEPEADPLAWFLASVDRFALLPDSTLVLPSHGRPFVGIAERLRQLHTHHEERLAEVRAACADTPRSAAEVLPVLFPRALDLHQTTFALGETVAHLHRLWFAGELQRTRDTDGVWRFGKA